MTFDVRFYVFIACFLWLAVGVYWFFVKKPKSVSAITGAVLRQDSDVIVSKSSVLVSIVFAPEEREDATPELYADFVVRYKDIIKGNYGTGKQDVKTGDTESLDNKVEVVETPTSKEEVEKEEEHYIPEPEPESSFEREDEMVYPGEPNLSEVVDTTEGELPTVDTETLNLEMP
jgi:hypothetical protein